MVEDIKECKWCHEEVDTSDLVNMDLGLICEHCLRGIESKGEEVTIID